MTLNKDSCQGTSFQIWPSSIAEKIQEENLSAYCGFRQRKLFNQLEKLVLAADAYFTCLYKLPDQNSQFQMTHPLKFPSCNPFLHVVLERVNADSDAGTICSAGGAYRGQTF